MLCIVVLKEKILPFSKTLFMGGGAKLGVIQKKFNVFGGQEENVQFRKIPQVPL